MSKNKELERGGWGSITRYHSRDSKQEDIMYYILQNNQIYSIVRVCRDNGKGGLQSHTWNWVFLVNFKIWQFTLSEIGYNCLERWNLLLFISECKPDSFYSKWKTVGLRSVVNSLSMHLGQCKSHHWPYVTNKQAWQSSKQTSYTAFWIAYHFHM